MSERDADDTSSTSDDGSTPLRLSERLPLVVAVWTLSLFASAYEIVPASVAPVIVAELGVDAAAVSWLISIMFAMAMLASIPMGLVLARIRLRTALIGSGGILCVSGVASWWFTAAGLYWPLLFSRLVAGIGFVLMWNAALETYGRFADRATATGLFIASSPVGFALGHVTGPLLATGFGLPVVFLAYPLLLVPPVLVLTAVDDVHSPPGPRTESADSEAGDANTSLTSLGDYATLLGNRAMGTVCALGFISYSLYLFVNSWMPNYLNAQLGFSIAESGLLIAVFPLVGAVSRTAGGVVSDRLFHGRRRPVVRTTFVATTLLIALLYVSRSVVLLTIALLGSGFFVQLSLGLFYSYVPELLPDGHVSAGISLLTSISLLGATTSPLIAASLIEHVGSYVTAFGYAFGLGVLGIALAWGFTESTSAGPTS